MELCFPHDLSERWCGCLTNRPLGKGQRPKKEEAGEKRQTVTSTLQEWLDENSSVWASTRREVPAKILWGRGDRTNPISTNSHNWLSQSVRWSYLIFRCVSILFGRTMRRRNKGGRSTKTQDFNHGGRCQIVVHLHMKKHMLLACSIGVVWQPPWLKSWGI